jgi:hypothetical protein
LACWSQGRGVLESFDPPHDAVMDFFQEWASARNLFEGLPIYTSQRITIERYLGKFDAQSVIVEVNAHPPTSVLLAIPFVPLDYFKALVAWNLVSLCALLASLWIVARQLSIPLKAWCLFPAIMLLMFNGPFRQQNLQGQLNLILLLLLTGAWALDRSERPWLAGALLGMATAIKLFPAFLILFFLIRKRWKVAIGAILSLVAWTGFTLAVLGASAYRSYFFDVIPQVQDFISLWTNSSLTGLCRKLFGPATQKTGLIGAFAPVWNFPILSRIASLVLSGVVVAVLVWFTRRAHSRREADRAFGLALTAMLLVSPITWDHYFLLLLVPLALVWLELPDTALARLWFLFVVMALWTPPRLLSRLLPPGQEHTAATQFQAITVLSIHCYALIGLFVLEIAEPLWKPRARVPRAANERRELVGVQ